MSPLIVVDYVLLKKMNKVCLLDVRTMTKVRGEGQNLTHHHPKTPFIIAKNLHRLLFL